MANSLIGKPAFRVLLFGATFFFFADVWAQNIPVGPLPVTTVDADGAGLGLHGGKKSVPVGKRSPGPAPGALRGSCGIVPSDTMMLPGPCVNIMLVLNDEKGVEVERTRTNTQGAFEFSVDINKVYRVVSGSKLYEILAPQGLVHGGSTITVKIREK